MASVIDDVNRIHTGAAYDGSNVQSIRVDPSTSRLLIEITPTTTIAAPTLRSTIPRDSNFVPVSGAVTDDGNSTVTPLIINNSNNLLWIDVVIE